MKIEFAYDDEYERLTGLPYESIFRTTFPLLLVEQVGVDTIGFLVIKAIFTGHGDGIFKTCRFKIKGLSKDLNLLASTYNTYWKVRYQVK